MSTTKQTHTPGPWFAIPGPSFDQILIGRSPAYDPRPIATVNPVATHESNESVTEQKANSRLIAAAPELKDALLEMLAISEACPPPMSNHEAHTNFCLRIIKAEECAKRILSTL